MTEQPNREVAVLNAALELHPAERAAYLDQACAGDAALRGKVEALLHAHEQAESFLEAPPAGLDFKRTPRVNIPLTEKPGDRIGRYKLLQQIGEGGCGVVYMAEQEEPVRRRVALKVIKLGMDTKQVIARFEAERQALALMDHPNIAKIYDAGITGTVVAADVSPAVEPGFHPGGTGVDDSKRVESSVPSPGGKMPPSTAGGTPAATLSPGRPYFVMELVRGIKITDFCDENKLSTQDRLKLFIQVCQAIQHAHQKGVIHRDIKPSNILVTVNDGVPVPKVIDFGIAKATAGRLTDHTLFTAFEQFIGTPAYMSPEQAVMTSLDIDTRSDIYSLGVLLYELLTGRPPFDQKELLAAGLDEMRRTIREKEPPKPSTRLTQELVAADVRRRTSGETETSASSPRRLQELIHSLRGDLDWIAMKCLEKDRARRYETANGLAADIQRHLSNEPVVACPPGNLYRFQKLVRRNKLAFAAAAAVATTLVAGVVVSSWQAIRATRAEREQIRLRQQAEGDKEFARIEAGKSEQVAKLLKDMLKGVGPSVALGNDTKILRDVLDQTAQELDNLKGQPAVEADLRATVGNVYFDLGEYANAAGMHRKALELRTQLFGGAHRDTATSLYDLGEALRIQGKHSDAEPVLREALAIRIKLFGEEHLDVARSLDSLAVLITSWLSKTEEAEVLARRALAIRQKLLGPENLEVASSLDHLGAIFNQQGNFAAAEGAHQQALAMHRKLLQGDHLEIASSMQLVAWSLSFQGKLAEAEVLFRDALTMQRRLLPAKHSQLVATLLTLGTTLSQEQKYAEAETVFQQGLQMRRELHGDNHPSLVSPLNALANVLRRERKWTNAEPLFREALAIDTKSYGNYAPPRARLLTGLAAVLLGQGKFAEANSMKGKVVEEYRKTADGGDVAAANKLAWSLATCTSSEFRDGSWAVILAEKAVASTSRTNANYLDTLAAACAEAGDFAKAVGVQKEAIALLKTDAEKKNYTTRLKLYESNSPYREP